MKTRTLLASVVLLAFNAGGALRAQPQRPPDGITELGYAFSPQDGPAPYDGSSWGNYRNDTGSTISIYIRADCSTSTGTATGWVYEGQPGVPKASNIAPGEVFSLAVELWGSPDYYEVRSITSYSVEATPVTISWSTSTPTFNGSTQTGATATISPAGAATISGDSGIFAGSYTATATLTNTSAYYWAGGQATTANWSIAKAGRNLSVGGQSSGTTNTWCTFTASPSAGGGTITWDGGATGGFNTYLWSAVGSYTVSATIAGDPNYNDASDSTSIEIREPITYSVTVNISPAAAEAAGCTAWASPSSNILYGESTSLGASAAAGWQFDGWEGDSPSNIQRDITVTARFSVSIKPVTFTFGNLSHTYDGSPKTATVTCSDPSATYTTDLTKGPGVNSYTVSATAYGSYSGSGSDTLTINPAGQTVGISPSNQTITVGQSVTFTATGGENGYVWGGEASGSGTSNTVTFSNAGTFTVTVYSPSGGNYEVSNTATATVIVNKATQPALTLNSATPQTYGTTQTLTTSGGAGGGAASYAITGQSAAGVATLAGSTLTANAGTGWVDLQATKAGDANYLDATSATVRVNFQPKTVTPSVTAAGKIYDGTTAATITGRSLTGALSADDVTLTGGTAVLASKTVGAGKTVTATGLTLAGTQAGNYTLISTTATTTASIAAKMLNASGITAGNKVYDGNTIATLNFGGASLVGVVAGDTVTLNTGGATGAFASKNVGNGQAVTIAGLTLAGADAGNYVLTQPATTADITAKGGGGGGLAVVGIMANDKTYDGNTVATLNLGSAALSGVIPGDTVSLNASGASGAFGDKNAGAGKTVTILGLTLIGADAGNYSLTPLPTTTASITKAMPTITWTQPAAITYGTPLSATQLNATASVPGGLTYAPAANAFLNAGAGQTLRVELAPADPVNYNNASATTTITVNKADQTVTLTPLVSTVPLGTPIAYTAAGGATGVYVWGGTAGASGGGATQTVTPMGGIGVYTVTVYASGDSNFNDSPPITATIAAQAQTLAISLTPLVSNYTVDNPSSPLNGKTYKRAWQEGGAWHAYLGRSGVQFQIVGQATAAVQAFELQALEPNADPSAWYTLATIAPPTGAPNGPGVIVTGIFGVSLDTASAGASLVPQSYAQGNPKTGGWQLRARTQDSSGTWSGWSNIVAVTADLPLTTKAVPAQSLPPAGPIGGWFTASDQTTFNLPVWIP